MDTKTKNTLISALLIVVMIGTMIGLILFSRQITPKFGLVILLLMYYFYSIPSLNKRYMRFYGVDCNIVSGYVPLLNEVSIMKPWIARTVILTTVLSIGSLAVLLIDPAVFGDIFGDIFALRYSGILGTVAVYSFVASEAMKGLGYVFVFRDISYNYSQAYSGSGLNLRGMAKFISSVFKYIPALQYIFLFFPILRIASLVFATDKLEGLLLNNKFYNTIGVVEELEEETI